MRATVCGSDANTDWTQLLAMPSTLATQSIATIVEDAMGLDAQDGAITHPVIVKFWTSMLAMTWHRWRRVARLTRTALNRLEAVSETAHNSK